MEEQTQSQSAPTQTASVSPIPAKQNNKSLIIAAILILLLMAGGLVYLGYQNYQLQLTVDQLMNQKPNEPIVTSTPTARPSPLVVNGGQCTNNVLGVNLTIPQGWICKSQELSETDGWMDIKSELFTIQISNLGRGPYCGDGPPLPNTDDSCRTSSFVENEKVNLTLFTSYSEDKEIFGGIVPLNKQEQYSKTWISIKYSNMEKQKLTDSQKAQLISFLNTITIIK